MSLLSSLLSINSGGGGGGGAVDSVFGRTGDVTAHNGDYTASKITNTPAGNVTSTTVQGAINQLNNLILSTTASLNFSFGDASPSVLFTIAANKIIEEVRIIILTEFDGVGASLKVGDALQDDLLLNEDQNDPTIAATYISTPNISYNSPTQILLTINSGSGATQGSGILLLKYKL